MQSVSSRIWTRVAVSISYDDNHYSTGYHYHLPKFTCTTQVTISKKEGISVALSTRVSQKFGNILVRASMIGIYNVTKAIQAAKVNHYI